MFPNVWLQPGVLIIYGASLDASSHKHHAIQLVLPKGASRCQFEDKELSGPVVINSLVEHQLHMETGWVLLVEPQSDFGQKLSEYLVDKPVVEVSTATAINVAEPKGGDSPIPLLAPILSMLEVDAAAVDRISSISPMDKRIRKLLLELDSCFVGECQKPIGLRASKIARQLALSEGRFLHLFRDQMGIAWRPYLLWRRTICAIRAITKGQSATDAAHLAGFSDSAHLSRSFRSLFGMSIREAKNLVKST